MEDILTSPYFWIVIAALSEIIGISPLKDNSIVQLVLKAINSIKPVKKGWLHPMAKLYLL